jgi:signal transduction histidine kinase
VSVQDCGVGLPADQGDRVFEPFFTTKTEGLGMGLAICRAIVQAHHGQIGARNNLDRGSTFQFTLPLTGAPPSSEPNGLGNHG